MWGKCLLQVLFPDDTRIIVFWEQLCKRFPPGIARDSLIAVLFNGNYTKNGRLEGNCFEHAKPLSPSTTLHTPPPPAQQECLTQLPQGVPKWQTPSFEPLKNITFQAIKKQLLATTRVVFKQNEPQVEMSSFSFAQQFHVEPGTQCLFVGINFQLACLCPYTYKLCKVRIQTVPTTVLWREQTDS